MSQEPRDARLVTLIRVTAQSMRTDYQTQPVTAKASAIYEPGSLSPITLDELDPGDRPTNHFCAALGATSDPLAAVKELLA
jgi:hypothetical protein